MALDLQYKFLSCYVVIHIFLLFSLQVGDKTKKLNELEKKLKEAEDKCKKTEKLLATRKDRVAKLEKEVI